MENKIKIFAEMIRDMVGDRLIDCVITINEVVKNNDSFKTGLTIKGKNSNWLIEKQKYDYIILGDLYEKKRLY